jgi:hypothetical protein
MLSNLVQKKSDWIGLVFLASLTGFAILAYVFEISSAAWTYPAPALLAGSFGLGVFVQSIRLTKTSDKSRLVVTFSAIGYFLFTVLMAAKDATSPEDILNRLAISYLTFTFFWYFYVIYKIRLAVDEVHILSVSLLAWIFFFGTSSWWWYGTLVATVVGVFALLRHGQIHGLIRFLLFGWFTAINAFFLWSQFGSAYATIFSITETGSSFSSALASEMFAAGLAAPVALFPLFHALLVLPLAVLILNGLFSGFRHRIKEFTDHIGSIVRSVENVSLGDWRVLGIVGGVAFCSALAIFGILEKPLAVNIAYALIGLWISLRVGDNEEEQTF